MSGMDSPEAELALIALEHAHLKELNALIMQVEFYWSELIPKLFETTKQGIELVEGEDPEMLGRTVLKQPDSPELMRFANAVRSLEGLSQVIATYQARKLSVSDLAELAAKRHMNVGIVGSQWKQRLAEEEMQRKLKGFGDHFSAPELKPPDASSRRETSSEQ